MTETRLAWKTIEAWCKILADTISLSYQPEVVVGIAKGGLIPSVLITNKLKCPNLVSVQVVSYRNRKRLPAQIWNPLRADTIAGKVLLVDDIVDSGHTMSLTRSYLASCGAREIKTVSLVYKPNKVFTPDFWAISMFHPKEWVVFPWEVEE